MTEVLQLLIGPCVGAIIAYWFGIRGKKTEINLNKNKELNTILSNMLNVWHYYKKIEQFSELSTNTASKLIFPKSILPIILLRTGILNEKCFSDLDTSIEEMKGYDPVIYFEIEGLGKKYEYFKENFLLPFIEGNSKNDQMQAVFETAGKEYLRNAINDIQIHLMNISKNVSSDLSSRINQKIVVNIFNLENEVEELNQDFYRLVTAVLPKEINLSYEQFKIEFSSAESQVYLTNMINSFVKSGQIDLKGLIQSNL